MHLIPVSTFLQPHIVWFGEAVPAIEEAIPLVESADILCIIGTSLNVYPAAGLLHYASYDCPVWLIDHTPPLDIPKRVKVIARGASEGITAFMEAILPQK